MRAAPAACSVNWLKPMTVLRAATEAHGRNNAMPLLRAGARRTLCVNRVRGRHLPAGENRGLGRFCSCLRGPSERRFLLVFDTAADARRHGEWVFVWGLTFELTPTAEASLVRPGGDDGTSGAARPY